MENLLLSDKNNYDIEYIIENLDGFFDTIDCILSKFKDDKSLNDETSKCNRIRVPNLSTQSVYHNPQSSATRSELTESALSKLESEHTILTDQYRPFNTQNALNNDKKACMPVRQTSQQHHHRHSHHHSHNDDRMQFYLTSIILMEFLHGLYYLFHNGYPREAFKAIESISKKGEDELMCDVMLTCNSIKSSLKWSNNNRNEIKSVIITSSPNLNRQSVGNTSVRIKSDSTSNENTVGTKTKLKIDKSDGYDGQKSNTSKNNVKPILTKQDKNDFTNLNNIPLIDDSNGENSISDDNNKNETKQNESIIVVKL